jgi:MOSC domain-containing protein YiiM
MPRRPGGKSRSAGPWRASVVEVGREGRIAAVCVSLRKGIAKSPVPSARLRRDHGIEGDAHAGSRIRQISLLPLESIERARLRLPDLQPGAFGENLVTERLDLARIMVGARLQLGR